MDPEHDHNAADDEFPQDALAHEEVDQEDLHAGIDFFGEVGPVEGAQPELGVLTLLGRVHAIALAGFHLDEYEVVVDDEDDEDWMEEAEEDAEDAPDVDLPDEDEEPDEWTDEDWGEDETLVEPDFREGEAWLRDVGLRYVQAGERVRYAEVPSKVNHHQCADAIAIDEASAPSEVVVACTPTISIYDLDKRKVLGRINVGPSHYSISRHGDLLAVCGDRGYLQMYRLKKNVQGEYSSELLVTLRVNSTNNMCNSVRFCQVDSTWKLLLAGQDRYVYAFSLPGQHGTLAPAVSTSEAARSQGTQRTASSEDVRRLLGPNNILCNDLRAMSCTEPVRRPVYARAGPSQAGSDYIDAVTDAVGPFPSPVNFVITSPNGQWLAAACDSLAVFLLHRKQNFSVKHQLMLSFMPDQSAESLEDTADSREGCQYLAWNTSSTLLAASSDAQAAVSVWRISSDADTPAATMIAHYSRHMYPCLALSFAPDDDQLLFYIERGERLHIRDTRSILAAQTVSLPAGVCITGLAVGSKCGALVAAQDGLYMFPRVNAWSRSSHRTFPTRFKEAVKALLKIARSSPETGAPAHPVEHSHGLWSLPTDVLLSIVPHLAFPLSAWQPPKGMPLSEGEQVECNMRTGIMSWGSAFAPTPGPVRLSVSLTLSPTSVPEPSANSQGSA
eukprot:jgi/Chlat1/4541/Chrsp29S04453